VKKPRGRPRKSAIVETPAPEAAPAPRIVQEAVRTEPMPSPPQLSIPLPAPDPTPEPNIPQLETPEGRNAELGGSPIAVEPVRPPALESETPRPASPATLTAGRGRVNVSHLRRENEILRVVEESGGIVNIQTKEFYEAHMALLETLGKAGEPTSAPVGTRTDKRTASLTIDSLERKSKVKQLKTAVATHTGLNKPATIVYLPATTQAQLNTFLADLSRASQPSIAPSNSTVKIAERLEYGADPTVSSRGILPLQLLQSDQPSDDKKERWSKNATRADQLFRSSDEHIRDILLTERTTIGQVYGFIVGRAARAREFHLTTLQVMQSQTPSPYILPDSRIVDLNYFCQDVPVGLFTKFVAALSFSAQLETLFETEAGRTTPVKDLSQELHTMLQVGRSRSRSRILDLFDFLRELQVAIPLKSTQSANPFITCQPHGDHPTTFDPWTENDWTPSTPHAAPTYWYFTDEAPVHLWNTRESNPPYWQSASTVDVAAAQQFWELLRTACMASFLPDIIAGGGPTPSATASISVGRSLRRTISWNDEYVLTWHQMKFLDLAIDVATGTTVLDEPDPSVRANALHRLCWVTSAPLSIVESHIKSSSRKLQQEKEKILSKNKELKRLKRLAEGKSSIAKKAEEAKAQREKDWVALITRVHPGEFGVVAARIERVRTRFMQASTVRDLQKWEKEVLDAVREAEVAATKILPKATARRSAAVRAPVVPNVTPTSGPPIESGPPPTPEGNMSHIAASIQGLIRQQEPLLAQGVYKRKGKGKKKAAAAEGELRDLRAVAKLTGILRRT
jgi:oxalate---CoA ligase